MRLARGELGVAEAAKSHDIPLDTLQSWVDDFFSTAKGSLDETRRTLLGKHGIEAEGDGDLGGRIEEIATVDLLQTLGLNRKTGSLGVNAARGNGRLWLNSGVLVDAQAGPLSGVEALYRIMTFETGSFVFRFRDVDRPETIGGDLNHVLMEAMRRLDESKKILARLPDADLLIKAAPVAAALAHASPEYRIVVDLFSQGRTISEVLDESPLGHLATLQVIDELTARSALVVTRTRREFVGSESAAGLATVTMTGLPLPSSSRPKRNLWQLALAGGLIVGTVAFLGVLLIDPGDDAAPEAKPAPVVAVPEPTAKPEPEPEPEPCPEGMIFHRGGKLFVGSPSENPMLAMARPAHQVQVSSFCLDSHEVTVAMFRECSTTGDCERAYRESTWPQGSMKKRAWVHAQEIYSELCNEGQEGREEHPVNCVSWFQAKRYCEIIGKRLPYEVEWEFAARGSDGRVYPWGDAAPGPERLNACGDECRQWTDERELGESPMMYETNDGWVGTAPVGSYPKGRTQAGVDDMIGNVFEWTADGYYRYEEGAGAEVTLDPRGPEEAERRIIRGGAFNSTHPVHTDPALRFPQTADTHTHGIGFRCAHNPIFEPDAPADATPEATPDSPEDAPEDAGGPTAGA